MKLDSLSELNNKKAMLATSAILLILVVSAVGSIASSFNTSNTQEFNDYSTDSSYRTTATLDRGTKEQSDRKKAARIDIELQTSDISMAEKEITSLIDENNGYITSNRIDRKDSVSGTIVARIPSNNSSNFVSQIENLGKIESKTTTVDDVTDQYSEIEAELRNRRQELNRLEQLLDQTENVSELIQVEERLSTVRSRIDYLEERKARLDTRVEYDEVTVRMSEPTLFNTGFEPKQTISDAYRGFFNSLTLLIVGIGYLMPLLLMVLIGYIGLRMVRAFKNRF